MAKYDGWTLGETEAILNIIGGTDIARAVLRGECKLIVEAKKSDPPFTQPLIGVAVKTLVLKPYSAESVADAIKLGKYDAVNRDVTRLFIADGVGLDMEAKINLVQFDRDPASSEEVFEWAKAHGDLKPILPAHIYGIGIQYPDVQRRNPIVEFGSVHEGKVLCLSGNLSNWRNLLCATFFRRSWERCSLFGFLDE